ncbi:MAG TPA: RuBisCO large subunit C-terminal-like domain-containing protein [Patescibacteria group bacterium]|nr:RuBisCO long chain, Form III-like [uncultured bacterium]HLD01331.1 RuBisCO large subunit C-terminal-like domain-containing protein [Patescibacteria group bacterium]
MAVQFNYIASEGWKPENPDEEYVIVQFKIELADGVDPDVFPEAAASVAAESSTGTWTKVEERADSGIRKADEYKALAFDLDKKNKMFKVAYKVDLFEHDNMSGFLAGPVGNVGGMKMVKGVRVFDIRFPKPIVKSFPGPLYGIEGVRDLLNQDNKQRKMPILGTVPKPKVGRSAKEQADLARRLWLAGDGTYDFLKDDENLTSLPFNTFEERVKLVHAVQKEAEKKTGKKKLYLSNITHSNIDTMVSRANMIKDNGGRCMMIDVITTGFAAVHTIRLKNPELIIHAHRAMHAFITRESGKGIAGQGSLNGFSISMFVFAKIFRLLGVDSMHGGSPKSKMEDYGESVEIMKIFTKDVTDPNQRFYTLGQNWFGMKTVWPVASGGLHPGVMDTVVEVLGSDCYIQLGGGVLGHPEGAERGVESALEARSAIAEGITVKEYASKHPNSALAKAVELWGTEPKIVY